MESWQLSADSLLTFAAATLSAGLSLLVWRRRAARGARLLLLLVSAAAIWGFVYAAEVATVPADLNFVLNRAKYLVIVFVPVIWLAFALEYAGPGTWSGSRRLWLLVLFPLVTLAIIWTNARHGLFWADISLVTTGRFPFLEFVYGPWFWVHTGYSYVCMLVGAVVLGRLFWRSQGVLRRQSLAMLIGAAAPFVSNAITLSGISPVPELDLTPIAFTITSVFFAWGLFRLQLLDVLPQLQSTIQVASAAAVNASLVELRTRILELLLSGSLVLGSIVVLLGVIEELNERARLGTASAVLIVGYGAILALKFFARLPYVVRAGGLLISLYVVGLRALLYNGLEADAGIILFAAVVFALVLFDLPTAIGALGAGLLLLVFGGRALLAGSFLPAPVYVPDGSATAAMTGWLSAAVLGALLLGAQAFIGREMRRLVWVAQDLSRSLEAERGLLEQRVAERARLLGASNEASRQIAALSDPAELAQGVVSIIRDAFDYYFVQVYLLDPEGEVLRLTGATGPAGSKLLRKGHRLSRHQGLVGQSVLTRDIVATGDVTREPNWLPNPLLPDTRSESAVPLVHDGNVLGVLDVQQDRLDGIAQEETLLLAAIADQVAAAMFSVRSLESTARQARHQATLLHIIRCIDGTTTMSEALRVAAEELGRVLPGASIRVRVAPGQDGAP